MGELWKSFEKVAEHVRRPGFSDQWRAFLRDCTLLLLPRLPPEASNWTTAADEFDAGRLDIDGLTAARVAAWQFHDARQRTAPPVELIGLRTVMFRLSPPDAREEWDEAASWFLQVCEEAGLLQEQLLVLLRCRFDDILDW